MVRVVLIAAALALAGCDFNPQWQGYTYPNAANLTRSVALGRFSTFEQCQEAAIDTLRAYGRSESGDYECGRSCRFKPEWNINVCAETRK